MPKKKAGRVLPASSAAGAKVGAAGSGELRLKTRVGIIGLPNVGKSSIFNALARRSLAQAENFPFCTIDPNVAQIAAPDRTLRRLGKFAGSERTVPATVEFVDVAGLVSGASAGAGLGNRFLAHIRECDAVCHVLRSYEDESVVHVDGRVDPSADAEVVNGELLLADVAHVERRLEKSSCRGEERDALETLLPRLREGVPARAVGLSDGAKFAIKSMGLLTLKPVIYVFNVDKKDFLFEREEALQRAKSILASVKYCDPISDVFALVSAKLEAGLSSHTKKEVLTYFRNLGLEISCVQDMDRILSYCLLPNLVRQLLGLELLYTGPGVPPSRSKTTRAYLFPRSAAPTAWQMAGHLHGDIQKGFIKAEVTQADVLLDHSSYTAAKEAGRVRTEGKDYVMHPNDVLLVKWR